MTGSVEHEQRGGRVERHLIRPLELADLEQLVELDERHAGALGVERVVERASVHYYLRSGHSFVAARRHDDAPAFPSSGTAATTQTTVAGPAGIEGFVLAHSTWSGARAVVRLERVAVAGRRGAEAAAVAAALTAAVVKSAYDAGVYRLVAAIADDDRLTRDALEAASFTSLPEVTYQRLLGAGALSGAAGTTGDRDGGGDHDR